MQEEHTLMVPKNAQVADLLAALQKKAGISDEVMSKVRAYEAHVNKFHKVLPPDHSVMSLYDYTSIYAAPFPEDDSSKKISVFHFDREPSKAHGVPFQFPLKEVCYVNGTPLTLSLIHIRASLSVKQGSESQTSPRSRASN
jgi:ubiquitin carboxyl-terminal hydrolase 7